MRIILSVIIVAWRSREEILPCVQSIPAALDGGAVEVVVVDNSLNADGTADLVAREAPTARCLVPAENLGFGRGNNLGFRETSASACCSSIPTRSAIGARDVTRTGSPRKRLTVAMARDWLRAPDDNARESSW